MAAKYLKSVCTMTATDDTKGQIQSVNFNNFNEFQYQNYSMFVIVIAIEILITDPSLERHTRRSE